MDTWHTEGNEYYIQQLELSLSRVLSTHVNSSFFPYRGNGNELSQDVKETDGTVPPHFYGELAKTKEGCAVLTKSGHLKEFVQIIRDYSPNKATPAEISMKAALWAVGHIGTSIFGLPLLQEADVIKDLVAVCEKSTTLSLRGTAFYVLGLISKVFISIQSFSSFSSFSSFFSSSFLPFLTCCNSHRHRRERLC
jgi:rapamycin-insensitive companion of mTOR